MATIKEIKELALHAAKHTAPTNFSVENVDEALREEMRGLASSVNEFMRNRYDIYDIIIQTADEVVPNKVISALGMFAEVQVVKQGDKALFKKGVGKNRAKKFLTQVGLSGVYETFRLDNETFEVPVMAVGGAATIDFERFLDGAEDMADIMEIITTGLTDAVFIQVQKALKAAVSATARPAVNLVSKNTFVADDMVKLVNVVRAYGSSAVIFAPPEFVAAMGADAIVPVSANNKGVYSPQDIEAIHNTGYINMFRGTPIVQIPQSFIDENNDIICPTGQITRISSVAGKLYLHFLFFKKTQYLNTDTYWKENFYQIPRDFDFLQGGIVEINTNHIKIRNEET